MSSRGESRRGLLPGEGSRVIVAISDFEMGAKKDEGGFFKVAFGPRLYVSGEGASFLSFLQVTGRRTRSESYEA